MNYWLMKSEPFMYSWDDLVAQGVGHWDGVRSHAARLHLMAMKVGDWAFFYHSNEGIEIVGIAEIVREHYQDTTAEDPRWVAVDVKAREKLAKPVTLKTIKADERLSDMALIKQSRLSVCPVTKEQFDIILAHAQN